MLKKLTAFLLAAAMIMSLMAGCTSKKNDEDKTGNDNDKNISSEVSTAEGTEKDESPKPVTITVSNWPKGDDEANIKIYEEFVKTMNEKYPYITIKGEEWGYDVNSFLPKAASGQLPNLYETFFTESSKIIDAGYCADVTEVVKQYGYDKSINPDMMKLVTKDGKYYGLPGGGYTIGLMYNVNVFKEAGLLDDKGIPKFPRTYEELAETAKEIKEKTGKAGFFLPTKNNQGGWMFMNIAWSYGAEFEKKVDGKWKAVFNSPEAVQALQYVKDLKWKYNVLPDNNLVEVADMWAMLGTDQVGMSFGISDWTSIMILHAKTSKDSLAMSRMPEGPKGAAMVLGGGIYMFSPNSTPEQIDACFKWLEVKGYSDKLSEEALKGLEEQAKANQEQGYVVGPHGVRVWTDPARVALEDEILKKYQNVNMELWNDYVENNSKGMRPEEPVNAQELYKELDAVIQTVLTDKNADPQKVLDQAVSNFQKDYLDKAE